MKLKPAKEVCDATTKSREDCHQELLSYIANEIDCAQINGRYFIKFDVSKCRHYYDPDRVVEDLRKLGYIVNLRSDRVTLDINWRTANSSM